MKPEYVVFTFVPPMVILCLSLSLPMLAQTGRQDFEQRIFELLTVEEFKAERREILGYGDRALPVLAKVLSSPHENELDELRAARALGILRDLGGGAPKLRPLVRRQLVAKSALVRGSAAKALISIGSPKDIPALVAMLYDPRRDVRRLAALLIGKLGDEAALPALEIWHKQAAEADRRRRPQERWLIGSMPEVVEKAKKAIRERTDNGP